MSFENFFGEAEFNYDAEKQKLIQIISQGSQVLGEVDDLKSGLRDTVKAVAEELDIKPALLSKAIAVAFKESLAAEKHDIEELEELLAVAKKA